ncbi:MAG: methyltransferase domain-containing protein [Pseudorhodoplanes sp.]|jgi:SAM-dependent methyltransferase|nr:methyltransferase domain-containing protein [Pseudorhodoplanes sp.]
MTDTARHDVWAQGEAYERYVGRWSRPVADQFLQWLAIPSGKDWLDIGCGTGALSQRILQHNDPARIVGVDSSDGFVAHAEAHVADPRASFRTGDARELPVANDEFDAAVSGLVLNFVPDQQQAVAEMRRATRPSGTVAAYVWDYEQGMELMRRFWDAAIALDPAARGLDEGLRFPLCRPDALNALFAGAGLSDVAVTAIDIPTVFADFDDYWSPFLGGQGPAPGYCMKLPEAGRDALRERLRASLPADGNGNIPLTARAWAVRGTA